jgi:hypothetical protein
MIGCAKIWWRLVSHGEFTVIKYPISLVALLLCGGALADPQVPEKLLGVWTTDDSTLKGEMLTSGRAIYIDIDGVGDMLTINGKVKTNTRIVVTTYSEKDHRLEVDLTDQGQVQGHLTLNYDETQTAIVPADDPESLYHRRKLQMSPDTRQALGLEPAPLSVPPIRRR